MQVTPEVWAAWNAALTDTSAWWKAAVARSCVQLTLVREVFACLVAVGFSAAPENLSRFPRPTTMMRKCLRARRARVPSQSGGVV
eukprot:12619758-Alexandrium_andersonii.AAC.1